MAYGLVSNSILLALGLPPAVASATVYTAEVFTTGVSGASHAWFGNVRWRLFWQLAVPGAITAPFVAWLVRHLPERAVMAAVGSLIVLIGLGQLARQWW